MSHALAAAHHAVAFNGLFYATMATVVPLLFLAVAVQGRTYDDLVEAIARLYDYDPPASDSVWPVIAMLAIVALPFIALAVLIVAAWAEISAVLALEWQRPEHPLVIVVAAAGLTVMSVVAPARALARTTGLPSTGLGPDSDEDGSRPPERQPEGGTASMGPGLPDPGRQGGS